MWCSTCRSESVSAGPTAGGELLRCAQCGTTLGFERSQPATIGETVALEHSLAPPSLPENDWQLEADVRSAQRLVDRLRNPADHAPRIDRAAAPTPPHVPLPAHVPQQISGSPPARTNIAAWSLLSLGLATFACGAVLLGWSYAADRPDLWTLGMPLALGGQAALIVGLVLQLEGLWHSRRQTEQTLSAIDGELTRVRQATALLSAAHPVPAPLSLSDFQSQFDRASEHATRHRASA